MTILFGSILTNSSEEDSIFDEDIDEAETFSFCKKLSFEKWQELEINFQNLPLKLGEGSFGVVRGDGKIV